MIDELLRLPSALGAVSFVRAVGTVGLSITDVRGINADSIRAFKTISRADKSVLHAIRFIGSVGAVMLAVAH